MGLWKCFTLRPQWGTTWFDSLISFGENSFSPLFGLFFLFSLLSSFVFLISDRSPVIRLASSSIVSESLFSSSSGGDLSNTSTRTTLLQTWIQSALKFNAYNHRSTISCRRKVSTESLARKLAFLRDQFRPSGPQLLTAPRNQMTGTVNKDSNTSNVRFLTQCKFLHKFSATSKCLTNQLNWAYSL